MAKRYPKCGFLEAQKKREQLSSDERGQANHIDGMHSPYDDAVTYHRDED